MEPYSLICPSILNEIVQLAESTPIGAIAEFGVYQGGSAYRLYEVAKRKGVDIYLYDTFEGIPFRGEFDVHNVGDFSDTTYQQVKDLMPDAIICKGVFPESVVDMPPMSFVHIDADQYQSYIDAFNVFIPLMIPGGIMWFDDVNALASADKAVKETFGDRVVWTASGKAYVRF